MLVDASPTTNATINAPKPTNARGFDGKKIPCVTLTRFQPRVAFASMRKPASTMTDGSRGVHRRAILPYPASGWMGDGYRCGRTDAAETVDGNLNLGFGDNVNVGL